METVANEVEGLQTEKAYKLALEELWELLTAEHLTKPEYVRLLALLDCVEAYEKVYYKLGPVELGEEKDV